MFKPKFFVKSGHYKDDVKSNSKSVTIGQNDGQEVKEFYENLVTEEQEKGFLART